MKISLTLFFLFLIITTYGQRAYYKGQPLDSLIITSNAGVCRVDEKGTCIGQKDCFIVFYDKKNSSYKGKHVREFTERAYKIEFEKIRVKQLKNHDVNASTIDSLLKSILVKVKRPTIENLDLSNKEFSRLVNRKNILRIAKRYKADWQFKHKYSYKAENKIVFNDCCNIDTFRLFLNNYKIDTTAGLMIWAEIWDNIDLQIKAGVINGHYEGVYGNTCKQPWYNHSDTTAIILPTAIFNFDINKWLVKILPNNFYRRGMIMNNCLADAYIEWFLRRREIIYL